MDRRRLVVLILGLLIGLGLLSSLSAPRPLEPDAVAPGPAAGQARAVSAELPGPGGRPPTVRAAPGDLVALTVRSPGPDVVELVGLDRLEPVEPSTPARLEVVPSAPGRTDVRLQRSGRVVGRLDVRPAG